MKKVTKKPVKKIKKPANKSQATLTETSPTNSTVPCTPAAATGDAISGKDSTVEKQEATPRVEFSEFEIFKAGCRWGELMKADQFHWPEFIIGLLFALIVGTFVLWVM